MSAHFCGQPPNHARLGIRIMSLKAPSGTKEAFGNLGMDWLLQSPGFGFPSSGMYQYESRTNEGESQTKKWATFNCRPQTLEDETNLSNSSDDWPQRNQCEPPCGRVVDALFGCWGSKVVQSEKTSNKRPVPGGVILIMASSMACRPRFHISRRHWTSSSSKRLSTTLIVAESARRTVEVGKLHAISEGEKPTHSRASVSSVR